MRALIRIRPGRGVKQSRQLRCDGLKDAITQASLLAIVDPAKGCMLHTDGVTQPWMGVVLSQEQPDGTVRV